MRCVAMQAGYSIANGSYLLAYVLHIIIKQDMSVCRVFFCRTGSMNYYPLLRLYHEVKIDIYSKQHTSREDA